MPPTPPRVITPAIADRCGITPARIRTELRRGNWQRIGPGVLLTRPDQPTRDDWAAAGVLLGGRGSALTAWDAARHYGLGERMPQPELVTVLIRSGRHRRVGGVRLRATDRAYSWQRQWLATSPRSLPVVAAARAVADAALECPDILAVRTLVTSAVVRRRCTPRELATEYDGGPRNGSLPLRLGLDDVLGRINSVAEARALAALAAGPIPPFEPNVPVVDPCGQVVREVDVLWRELRAALEIDSRKYHAETDSFESTQARHNQLTRYSLAVVHYSPRFILDNRDDFVAEVREWLVARAAELGVELPRGRGARRPGTGGPLPFLVPAA